MACVQKIRVEADGPVRALVALEVMKIFASSDKFTIKSIDDMVGASLRVADQLLADRDDGADGE